MDSELNSLASKVIYLEKKLAEEDDKQLKLEQKKIVAREQVAEGVKKESDIVKQAKLNYDIDFENPQLVKQQQAEEQQEEMRQKLEKKIAIVTQAITSQSQLFKTKQKGLNAKSDTLSAKIVELEARVADQKNALEEK